MAVVLLQLNNKKGINMKLFKKQIVEAHRGAKGLVKFENTIDAFAKAIEVGSDAIELDIRKTKDNVIIVRHDPDYKGKLISELSKEELDNLTIEEGLMIPTLEQTLKFCKGKIFLDIELKEAGYEKDIIELILKYLNHNEFYIRSFIIKALRAVKKIDKNVITVLLVGRGKQKYPGLSRLSEIFPLFKILYSKCSIVSPYYKLLVCGYFFRMKIIGVPIIAWTVDKEDDLKRLLIDKKIDGVVTNYPNVAVDILKEKK